MPAAVPEIVFEVVEIMAVLADDAMALDVEPHHAFGKSLRLLLEAVGLAAFLILGALLFRRERLAARHCDQHRRGSGYVARDPASH